MTVMRHITIWLVAVIALGVWEMAPAGAADTPKGPKPEMTDELIEQGRVIYFARCSFCATSHACVKHLA